MFYTPDVYRPIGQIADYSYCPVMKAKSINFYVQDVPMILSEASKYNTLLLSIPMGLPYGIRTRVWSEWFPDTPFLGEMVSYGIYNELGGADEVMFPYDAFHMSDVPWDDIIA
ncbi:hypothetical protein [Pseudomonas phage COT4]|uniref:Uncharacterized protein n=1 Tax=Pseudomonas phage M5.1 TaxID=2873460 RepID=A0AAE8XEM2_9CAUD|nr:hypothetical protein QGX13_gp012 [Pseudomonas phage M5.1]UAV89613.1 hypothetical protein M51_12 [Pseudomonas phage M5.1]UGL61212.1 hypothetical protein [Pseudomonas phage COT4]